MKSLYFTIALLLSLKMVLSDIPYGFNFGNTQTQPNPFPAFQSNPFPAFQSKQLPQTKTLPNTTSTYRTSTRKTSTSRSTTRTSTRTTSTTKTSITTTTTTTTSTTTSTTTTTTSTSTSIKPTTTNACEQQCSSIFNSCKDFGLSNDYSLNAVYPLPNNALGECLCKSEQNVAGSYSECMKCLINNSNNNDITVPEQIIQNNCQVFANKTEIDTGKNPEINEQQPSINVRNIIIICAGTSGILLIIGGFKFRNYLRDRKRESVLLF